MKLSSLDLENGISTTGFEPAGFEAVEAPSETKPTPESGDRTAELQLPIQPISDRFPAIEVTSLGFGPGMKGATISGWEASITLERRDFDIGADQGMIGNSADVVIHVEADLRKPVPSRP